MFGKWDTSAIYSPTSENRDVDINGQLWTEKRDNRKTTTDEIGENENIRYQEKRSRSSGTP